MVTDLFKLILDILTSRFKASNAKWTLGEQVYQSHKAALHQSCRWCNARDDSRAFSQLRPDLGGKSAETCARDRSHLSERFLLGRRYIRVSDRGRRERRWPRRIDLGHLRAYAGQDQERRQRRRRERSLSSLQG